jgi:dihydrofolate reductase
MRKLIATPFNYSLNGLIADEGSEFDRFCFDLIGELPRDAADRAQDERQLDILQTAYAHIMGRTTYEGMAAHFPANPDHAFADILNAGRKVVFSRTMQNANWANTTIAAGDTAAEIDKLRLGGDGHIVAWGGIGLWRSLMRLDLIDEWHLMVFPYIADEGALLFGDVPKSYQLDLISSSASSNGIIELKYRRRR